MTNAILNFVENPPANVVTSYYVGISDGDTDRYVSQVRLMTNGEVFVRHGDDTEWKVVS